MGAQLLNWHVVAAALSGAFAVFAEFLYIRDIIKGGETKPNAVSFFLWTVLQAIALVAQVKAGASWSVVIVFSVTFNTAIITVLALNKKYGYRKYGKIDFFSFILAVAAIVLWQVTGNPVLAIILAVVGWTFCKGLNYLITYSLDTRD